MPNERWSTTQVLALAPDASSARAAQGLSGATKWEASGLAGDLLWGLCRGSGKQPYQVCVDLSEPAYRCSCPSRKFPCKHALGLMLMWSAGGVPEGEEPGWVGDWRAARATRASRPAPAKRAQPSEATTQRRADRVAAGLDELDRWLLDQVAHGLAGAERSGYGPYEAVAARLVDAQAPGAANAVRRLGRIAGVGQHWADRLLGELALLRLLVSSYGRVGELPAPLAATVRSRVGIPVPTEEVLGTPRLRDHWHVLGHADVADDRLVTRRTWLRGAASGRFALLLAFAPPGQALPADTVPGTVIDADLCWYPGALPMRAVIAERHAVGEGAAPSGAARLSEPGDSASEGVGAAAFSQQRREPGPSASVAAAGKAAPQGAARPSEPGSTVQEALAGWAAAVAAEPWCETVPMLLAGAALTDDRHLVDAAGDALPLTAGHDEPWWLLAATGGHPVTVAGEYGPAGFRPLAAWPDGRYVAAAPGPTGDRRGPALPAELLSTALVGTERRPFTGAAVDGLRLDGNGPGALLEGAAVALAYRRAGTLPATGRVPIDPAPDEHAPVIPLAAAHRLALLVTDGGVPGGTEVALGLLGDWLARAAERGYRVPAELLPALLDAGRRRAALRSTLAAVAGRRGAWLADRRPDWKYLLAESAGSLGAAPDPDDWATGTPGQRLAYLGAVRASDPAAGLALLTETFDSEDPDDRARLLGALATGLSLADEPLLERALDDRRKEVRITACDLLSALPGSALRQRMAERALACVRLERRPLGRDRLVVTPPAEFDAGMRRDGVQPRAPQGIGPQAWLLEEVVARTPLDTWTTAFDLPPADVLALPANDDWSLTVHKGMARAAAAQHDPAWAILLADTVTDDVLTAQLYEALPPAELARYAARALRRDPIRAHRLIALQSGAWADELAAAVLEAIEALARGERHAWHIGELCRSAAPSMPVHFADHAAALAERLHADRPDGRQAMLVAQLAAALHFRREMYEELP